MNSTFVTAFREAERAYNHAVRAWNAMSQEERAASGGSQLTPLRQAQDTAAEALIADAVDRHKVEERSVVYLVLGPQGWEIDTVTTDGDGLAGYDDGPISGEACEHGDELHDECEALGAAAQSVALPSARELTALLISAGQGPN